MSNNIDIIPRSQLLEIVNAWVEAVDSGKTPPAASEDHKLQALLRAGVEIGKSISLKNDAATEAEGQEKYNERIKFAYLFCRYGDQCSHEEAVSTIERNIAQIATNTLNGVYD